MEEFITECLLKKKEKFANLNKSKINEKANEKISVKNYIEKAQEQDLIDDKSLSPEKYKIENCLIF